MSKINAPDSPEVTEREKKHKEMSRRAGTECIVLLENDGILPMKQPCSLALFGVGARHTVRGGTGSGDVNTRDSVNVEQGLCNAGFRIMSGRWLDRQDEAFERAKREYDAWAEAYAKDQGMSDLLVHFSHPFQVPSPISITAEDIADSPADAAVYVISRTCGEGADRKPAEGDFELYAAEKEQIRTLAAAYPEVIVILNVGSVLEIADLPATPGVKAIVLMGQLGSTGGDALADVLTGKVTPSGKLTDTWARKYSDYPAADTFGSRNGDLSDEYYTEGIFVGYRYFDSFGVEPLYPFGYGLGYTSFEVSPKDVEMDGETVAVTAEVRNTGNEYSGREVVQVYVSAPPSDVPKPYQALRGYAKTGQIPPGGSETVQISFSVRDLASYDTKSAAWILDAGDYIVRVGNSSRSTAPAAVLGLKEHVKTQQLRNLFHAEDPSWEAAPPAIRVEQVPASVLRIEIDPGVITCTEARYTEKRRPYETNSTKTLTAADVQSGTCTVEELTAQLSIGEMADMCVGTLRSSGQIVGNASVVAAGAAGDTSHVLEKSRGIRGLVMADGPAGLRLTPEFRADGDGRLLAEGEDAEGAKTYYQYCTAIPVGTALAQSWNAQLVEEMGQMIGAEMKEFDIDIWLAPAMNIHRNPLCGRNFEYYSEDPLVTGKTAAAMTRGVQSRKDKAATIKHFAANNQEDNRYFTNAHVGEQALREIYLLGFETAVRESQPVAIMTSYNLLNGVHTANDYDLLQCACRDEWGFDGFIMTDWFTSVDLPDLTGGEPHKYPISSSTGCIYAGNDVQMPGSESNVEDIVRGVDTDGIVDRFRISLADLQFCTANVIRAVLRLSR